MKDTERYTERDWEELAARFSDEKETAGSDIENFTIEDELNTEEQWRKIGMKSNSGDINVDNAWNKLHSRIGNEGLLTKTIEIGSLSRRRMLLRIAATVVIIAGLGAAFLYISNTGILSADKVIIAGNDQRNLELTLPDGSRVWMNRNSKLTYKPGLGKNSRNVRLEGEAFFDIAHDASRPFIIDAGNARVKDIGTSFNVITNNLNNEVEVYVRSGQVMLSNQSGSKELILDPGYIGVISTANASRSINNNPNYLSWNTDLLSYNGETLEKVFSDLKRVHNINVVTDDQSILKKTIFTTFDKLPQDTIISIICTTFNIRYQKEGNNYRLSSK